MKVRTMIMMHEGKMKSFWKLSWKRPLKRKTRVFCNWNESRTSRHTKSPKTYVTKFEKLSKCFSRLEGPLASKSRGEPRNLLSNPRNWSFHSWTSRQTESQKSQTTDFWSFSKCFLRLGHWLTRESLGASE